MEHIRIDPKFRRRPRPKKAGWAARQVFKFLLEVSAEFDLHGRFSKSMQDVEWLADEWANGDTDALPTCGVMLVENLRKCVDAGLLHVDGDELVISDWDEFYKPAKSGAERQEVYRKKVTKVTKPVTRDGGDESDARDESDVTLQHSTQQHSTPLHATTAMRADGVSAMSGMAAPASLTASPAQGPEEAAAHDHGQARPVAAPIPPDPALSPDAWDGADFWRWAQDRRHASGYPPERPLPPRKLSTWWSEARMLVETKSLKEAFYRYGDDDYWRATSPPYPFRGFVSQWERFLPAKGASNAA